jgi:hypothetical protein
MCEGPEQVLEDEEKSRQMGRWRTWGKIEGHVGLCMQLIWEEVICCSRFRNPASPEVFAHLQLCVTRLDMHSYDDKRSGCRGRFSQAKRQKATQQSHVNGRSRCSWQGWPRCES